MIGACRSRRGDAKPGQGSGEQIQELSGANFAADNVVGGGSALFGLKHDVIARKRLTTKGIMTLLLRGAGEMPCNMVLVRGPF